MTMPEAIENLKRIGHDIRFSDYVDREQLEALEMAIGIMERLEDSVPGHPLRPSDGLPFGTTRDSVPEHPKVAK